MYSVTTILLWPKHMNPKISTCQTCFRVTTTNTRADWCTFYTAIISSVGSAVFEWPAIGWTHCVSPSDC